MTPIRNFFILLISLITIFVSLLFFLVIFLPHSCLIPETVLLVKLQEVGPLLLSPLTGYDHISYLDLLNYTLADGVPVPIQDDSNLSTTHKPPSSPDLLLIALTKYIGILGFSKIHFYQTMSPIWNIIMMACMLCSFLHCSVGFLMLLYTILSKKHPKLLLPWICFTILFLVIVLTALVSLVVAMATSLTWVQVQVVHCYNIIIICVTSLLLYGEIFLVISEFRQEQEAVKMPPGSMEQESFESDFNWSSSASWTSCAGSGSTPPPTYDQAVRNHIRFSDTRLEYFDDSEETVPKIPAFHSLPLSSFIEQSPSEVPVFHTPQPYYIPPYQPDPQPYSDHQLYPGTGTNPTIMQYPDGPDPRPYPDPGTLALKCPYE